MKPLHQSNTCPSQNSPGFKHGAVEQGAVEMVAHKVGAHHRAFAVFGSAYGFGDNQVSLVPQIQEMDVKHQSGIWRNHVAWKQLYSEMPWDSKDICSEN